MSRRVAALRPDASAPTPLNRLLVATQQLTERRRGVRAPFDYRLRLEPLGVGADAPIEGVMVRGKDLSEAGVGFIHDQPLPFRRVRLSSADPTLAALGLADLELTVVLRWCRFLGPGRYESGGRLIAEPAA